MSDRELLRLLDSRADGTAEALRQKRVKHSRLFEEVHAIEDEIVALSNVLASVMKAARDIRSGGSRKDETTGLGAAEATEKDSPA